MANGFCPYLLQGVSMIAGAATPQYKIRPKGFLNMLHTAGNPDAIKISNYDGHKKTVNVSFRKPFTKAQTETSISCEDVLIPSKNEDTVSVANTRSISIHLEDELVAQYCNDASQVVAAKGAIPATATMNEVVDIIMSAGNALLQGVNEDLLGLVTWGKNIVAGNNAAVSVNFPMDLTVQPLAGGVTKLMSDYAINGLTGRPQVVGSDKSFAYFLQQAWKNGADQGGFDSRLATAMMDYYHDTDYPTVMGSDQFGVFEPGAIQLVQYLQNTGFKAGEKGTSTFGVLPLPMLDPSGNVKPVKFDFQMKYVDCAHDFTDSYSGASLTGTGRGWTIILSKQFGLWQVPAASYRNEDTRFTVNGALRYTAANDCDTCS